MAKKDHDAILKQARERFTLCRDYEATARANAKNDVKFANGDAYNMYQWPDDAQKARSGDAKSGIPKRPCLTINKARQHCLQIINDQRQNKPGVQVRPAGGPATYDSAQIIEGIVRHIEYISNAQAAYDNASWGQVMAGIGWWRIVTDYPNANTFDQEIYIRRVGDLFSVYIDPDCQEADKSDATFGFVFDDMPRERFDATYPKYKDVGAEVSLNDDDWCNKDHVRVAEYYFREEKDDELIALPDGQVIRASEMDEITRAAVAGIEAQGVTLRRRPILTPEIKWCKIAGDKIIEETVWPGKYIPLIPVIGEETVINGVMDRKGHVRALIDPQRMYNYWSSAAVEAVALAPKAPFVTPAQAVAGYETYWDTANTLNHAYLPYNHIDEAGNPIERPQRQMPPEMPQAFLAGTKMAQEEMMMASGQYQAIMGSPSNETSGKAINARQRQGDNATYHYIDRLAQAIRNTGRQLIDLIPKIYDTERVVKILGKDGTQQAVKIDPNAPVASMQQGADAEPEFDNSEIAAIFNPLVGEYDVIADVGPAYATARQEGFNALSQIMGQNPEAFRLVGDIWAETADFPLADKVAKRLRNVVPVEARGGPPPEMQAMQQQFQQMAQEGAAHIQQLEQELAKAQQKLSDQAEDLKRKDYEAETNRLRAVGSIDPEALKPVVREMVSQMLGEPVVPLMQQHAAAMQPMQPATETMQP